MRRFLATSTALVLVLAACSGGSDPDAGADTAPPSSAPSTDVPSSTSAPEPEPEPEPMPLAAFASSAETSPLDLALAEFDLLFGDMPGAANVTDDGTLWPSATHSIDALAVQRDELTPDQQQRLDETIESLSEIEPVDAFFLDLDEAVPDGENQSGQGFRSLSTPAPDRVRQQVRAFGGAVRAALGGDPLLVYVEIVPDGSLDGAAAKASVLGELSLWRTELLLDEGLDGVANCVVQLTESLVVGDALVSTADARGVVAHELVHCWQGARLDGDVATMRRMGDWALEGMAALVGEQVGGITRFNAGWWQAYLTEQVGADGTWPLYPSSYAAIGFWTRIAELGDLVESMRATVDAAPDDGAMLQAALSTVSEPEWLAAGTVEQASWGPLWTSNGPGSPGSPRTAGERSVGVADGLVIESVATAAQRNVDFTVEAVPASPGSILRLGIDGFGVARAGSVDVLPAAGRVDFCIGECVCPDGVKPIPAERTLSDGDVVTASLVGTHAQASSATAEITVFNPDDYDCENPDLGAPAGGGIIGTWRANPNSLEAMFDIAFGTGPSRLDVTGVAGDVIMTFAADGTGTLNYNGVTLAIADAIIGDITLDGGGSFNWGGSFPDIRIDGVEFALSGGSSALGGNVFTITDDDVPSAGVTTLTASLGGDELVISDTDGTAGEVFFPVLWTRQSDE